MDLFSNNGLVEIYRKLLTLLIDPSHDAGEVLDILNQSSWHDPLIGVSEVKVPSRFHLGLSF